MAVGNFTVGSIDLSSIDENTGLKNTANVYFVPGIGRELSIAELVIAICLDRAADLEAEVVGIMESMSQNTKLIEGLLAVENFLVDKKLNGVDAWRPNTTENYYWAQDWAALFQTTDKNKMVIDGYGNIPDKYLSANGLRAKTDGAMGWIDFLNKEFGVGTETSAAEYFNILNERIKAHNNDWSWAYFSSDEMSSILGLIDSRLDSLNTTSQKTLIELQSLTNKRDQTYDLITAMTKNSLTAAQSIGANMR